MPKLQTIKENDKHNYIKNKICLLFKRQPKRLKKKTTTKTQETNQEKAWRQGSFSIHVMDKGLIHKTYKFTIQISWKKSNDPIKLNRKWAKTWKCTILHRKGDTIHP